MKIFVLNKLLLWEIVAIQKRYRNATLSSDVALSIIMICLQVWLPASLSNYY